MTDWDAPSPVAEWTARDVVPAPRRVVPVVPGERRGHHPAPGPDADVDPVAAWQVHSDAVQALLDDPASADKVLSNRHTGDVPLPEAIDRFYTSDVFMHTWDLARERRPRRPARRRHVRGDARGHGADGRRARRLGPVRRARAVPDDADAQTRCSA